VTRWTVMAHNVESLIWQRYAEAEENRAKRWYIRRQWAKFERFESWAYRAATVSIAVSAEDARLMRERFAAQRVEVVENGVDVDYFKPQRDVDRDPGRLLFLGSLDWLREQLLDRPDLFESAQKLQFVGHQMQERERWLGRLLQRFADMKVEAEERSLKEQLSGAASEQAVELLRKLQQLHERKRSTAELASGAR